MRDHVPPHQPDDAGFVLVSVLAVLAVFSALMITIAAQSRDAVGTALIGVSEARSDMLVQSGIELAGYELFVLKRGEIQNQQIRLDGGTLVLSAQSEAGKVDLNGSGRDLLETAYRSTGLGTITPERFAALVMDWRDADSETGEDGAEAADYAIMGLSSMPRNGPFRSVDDLQYLPGIPPTDLAALRDRLTVYNPRGKLDAYAAPAPLVAALPDISADIVEEVLTARRTRSRATNAVLDNLLLVQSARIDTASPTSFRVTILVQPDDSTPARSVTMIMAAGADAETPYTILD